MKVSENTIDAPTTSALESPDPRWPHPGRAVAPWWHTALFAFIIIAVSVLSSRQTKVAGLGVGHIKRYAFTIAWECLLALFAWWGMRMRGTPVRQLLGFRRSGAREWARDFGIALLFWIIAVVVLSSIAILLRLLHLSQPQKAVLAIAPQTLAEMLMWLALCLTAGLVEEFVFRGYLLQQFSSINGKLWIGVAASSLLFGAAHGYEGLGGMIAITAYGVLFCLLAIHRRSLRTGMIAHTWHDSITGIALAIAKHSHLL